MIKFSRNKLLVLSFESTLKTGHRESSSRRPHGKPGSATEPASVSAAPLLLPKKQSHDRNTRTTGQHWHAAAPLHLPLAVALLLAAIAGALAMAAAGTARITQLRRIMRRNRHNPQAG